jgi:hypothetical protein
VAPDLYQGYCSLNASVGDAHGPDPGGGRSCMDARGARSGGEPSA